MSAWSGNVMRPESLYGYGLVYPATTTTCSATYSDSYP